MRYLCSKYVLIYIDILLELEAFNGLVLRFFGNYNSIHLKTKNENKILRFLITATVVNAELVVHFHSTDRDTKPEKKTYKTHRVF